MRRADSLPVMSTQSTAESVSELIALVIDRHEGDLVDLRRDLHAHPELSWVETRTTRVVAERVERAGWSMRAMPGSGLLAEIGEGEPVVALRADIDALPVRDVGGEPWASTVDGVAHACGHDVHVASVLGAGLALSELHDRGRLGGRVRLLFQPAEEVMPGGARHLIAQGALDGVDSIMALHCEPSVDVGQIGLRGGALTSAADKLEVRLQGAGGHTSRPHLTGDLTFALAKVATELPAVLSRRMDPRSGVSLVWGVLRAGSAVNVIPDQGVLGGTVRILDPVAWAECEAIVRAAILDIVRPYGVSATVDYIQGVPPVANDPRVNALFAAAVASVLGHDGQVTVPQSLGGEDFGWYVEQIPGAMLRLGTRTPGGQTYDLHQGNLRVDERAIGIGARVLAQAAHSALVTDA